MNTNELFNILAIECGAPIPPENGQMIGSGILHSEQNRRVGSGIIHSGQNRRDTEEGSYYVGSTVQTVCHSGFVLIGEPIIRYKYIFKCGTLFSPCRLGHHQHQILNNNSLL